MSSTGFLSSEATSNMCFGHVVSLCSGRVILAVTNGVNDVDDDSSSCDESAPASNPIARARTVVRVIRGSGLRRDAFNEVIVNGNARGWFKEGQKTIQLKQLQLLRDVHTRWDSIYHMLNRLREMRQVSIGELDLKLFIS
jgi:hypothetical protein